MSPYAHCRVDGFILAQDVEFIMELPTRSLDFRRVLFMLASCSSSQWVTGNEIRLHQQLRQRDVSIYFFTLVPHLIFIVAPPQPALTLTTEYTPRERGSILNKPPPPLGSTPSATPGIPSGTPGPDGQPKLATDSGPDPSTLPVATAPPSHPKIDPSVPGNLDGRSIFEFDMDALAEKPWRRPGSDISDWFNYGFDEISWEAYCYRRRETGELASMLKGHVLVCLSLASLLRVIFALSLYARDFAIQTLISITSLRTLLECLKNNSRLCHPKSGQWS